MGSAHSGPCCTTQESTLPVDREPHGLLQTCANRGCQTCATRDPLAKLFDGGSADQFYDLEGPVLGEGASGSVQLARSKVGETVVAVKTVRLLGCSNRQRFVVEQKQQLAREIEITRSCDHPNIVKTLAAYCTGRKQVE